MIETTITLPPDLAELAAAKAATWEMSLEDFALKAIWRAVELPDDPWELLADVRAAVKASGVTDEELEAQINDALQEVRNQKHSE